MTIHDITPPITERLAVFPGDTPPSREVLLDIDRGDHIRLSTLHATVHLGAHVDAPSHYGRDGRTIDEVGLERVCGPCQVIDTTAQRGRPVTVADLAEPVRSERVLLRTGTFPDPQAWNDDFAPLDPALVDHLAAAGVRLVGVDTPSVDPGDGTDLIAHGRCFAHDILILEGIVLTDVEPGAYQLVALPLRLVGFDASPVRAVLFGGEGRKGGREEVR